MDVRYDVVALNDSLQYIKGVGPKRAGLLKKLGIFSVEDLLYYFPRRYEDRSNLIPISKVQPDQTYTIKGEILSCEDKTSWKNRRFHIFEVILQDQTATLTLIWFNQKYLGQYLKAGQTIIAHGKVDVYKDRLQMVSPEFEIIGSEESDALAVGRIVPIYSVTEGVNQRFVRQLVKETLDTFLPRIVDPLPYSIRSKYNFLNLAQCLLNIHYPQSAELQHKAYTRLSFEEFFLHQIVVVTKKLRKYAVAGIAHAAGGKLFSKLLAALPFELTQAQKTALVEIEHDMAQPFSMQRLLQGEVGSGKTVVAMLAGAIALDSGYQVAFMAPTEILAKQHYQRIAHYFHAAGIGDTVGLVTSETNKKEKTKTLKAIQDGKLQFVIGTHALIQPDVVFHNLSLVIIDEQHKFGVEQRAALPKKGNNPDLLIMTATPIPRTLSMTAFGDLDISAIHELPGGRLPIETFVFPPQKIDAVYERIRDVIRRSEQAYCICPMIEESDEDTMKSAQTLYKQFQTVVFKDETVGLIHGQLASSEADQVMKEFLQGKTNILIATSVLEVGIDVSSATCMVVFEAERFGLSQLHQLRGRIGRGAKPSQFIIVANPQSEEAQLRIQAIQNLSDGFKIAEEDLRIRGPGEFFGRRQHGLSLLRIANPITQMRLLKSAREEALALVRSDTRFALRQHQELLKKIKQVFPTFPNLDFMV